MQPPDFKIPLFTHQLASISEMEALEKGIIRLKNNRVIVSKFGILADPIGSGKTLTTLGLIAKDKREWDLNSTHLVKTSIRHNPLYEEYELQEFKRSNSTIILVGNTILGNWKSELQKTLLSYQIIISKKGLDKIDLNSDVILVNISFIKKFLNKYSNIAFKRFVFDEFDSNHIPYLTCPIAGFHWFISSTPDRIKYLGSKRTYLKKIFPYSDGSYYQQVIIQQSEDSVKESMKIPHMNTIYHICKSPIYNFIKGLVSDSVLNMVSANNIQQAVIAMGGKSTSNILDLVKKKKEHNLFLIRQKIEYWKELDSEDHIKPWKIKEKKVLNELECFEQRYKEMIGGECPICYEQLDHPIMELTCHNMFCGKCILEWLKCNNTCPMCRSKVKKEELVHLHKDDEKENNEREKNKIMSKDEKIVELVSKGGKFIIFSDHEFNKTKIFLKDNQIICRELKGCSGSIDKTIEKFERGEITCLLLNSKFRGAGINLQCTTDIIIYHDMIKDSLSQVIGRAQRFGRKDPLNVHYLCY